MKRVLSFGSYAFPDTQDQLSDNFTNVVPRTVRLPDLSGAFDEMGLDPAPTEVGSIKMKFLLLADTEQEITQKRDAVRAMSGWGVRKLMVQPADQSLLPRYCYARIQNIQMPENAKRLDTWQEVSIDFQVAYPRWMRDNTNGALWGSAVWDAFSWDNSGAVYNVGSADTSLNARWNRPLFFPIHWGGFFWGSAIGLPTILTNEGNAISVPQLSLICTDTAYDGLSVERYENGILRDQIRYTGTILQGQVLKIDCRTLSVKLDGSNAYSHFEYEHPAWLRLMPGENATTITMPSGGGKLTISYPHTWY